LNYSKFLNKMSGRRSQQSSQGSRRGRSGRAGAAGPGLSPNSLAGYVDTTDDEDEPMLTGQQQQHRTPPRRTNANDIVSPDSLAGKS
jgi:hypothetical protein